MVKKISSQDFRWEMRVDYIVTLWSTKLDVLSLWAMNSGKMADFERSRSRAASPNENQFDSSDIFIVPLTSAAVTYATPRSPWGEI